MAFLDPLRESTIAYLIAALIYLYTKGIKQQIYWMAGIIVGYSAFNYYFQFPDMVWAFLRPNDL